MAVSHLFNVNEGCLFPFHPAFLYRRWGNRTSGTFRISWSARMIMTLVRRPLHLAFTSLVMGMMRAVFGRGALQPLGKLRRSQDFLHLGYVFLPHFLHLLGSIFLWLHTGTTVVTCLYNPFCLIQTKRIDLRCLFWSQCQSLGHAIGHSLSHLFGRQASRTRSVLSTRRPRTLRTPAFAALTFRAFAFGTSPITRRLSLRRTNSNHHGGKCNNQ